MGIPVNTVQQRSGHSKASVTTDTYGHSMSHSQDEAAQRIDAMLLPAEPTIAVKFALKPSLQSPLQSKKKKEPSD